MSDQFLRGFLTCLVIVTVGVVVFFEAARFKRDIIANMRCTPQYTVVR